MDLDERLDELRQFGVAIDERELPLDMIHIEGEVAIEFDDRGAEYVFSQYGGKTTVAPGFPARNILLHHLGDVDGLSIIAGLPTELNVYDGRRHPVVRQEFRVIVDPLPLKTYSFQYVANEFLEKPAD